MIKLSDILMTLIFNYAIFVKTEGVSADVCMSVYHFMWTTGRLTIAAVEARGDLNKV